MGKVNFIRSSRKQWKCQKCGADINKGDSYYRGEVNFGPVFIRCNKCKLQPWEVTTSDWTRSIGEIVNTWQDNYSLDDEGVEQLYSAIEDVQSDVQDRLDNMPEGLQEGDIGHGAGACARRGLNAERCGCHEREYVGSAVISA